MAITLMPAPFDSHAWLGGDHLKVVGDIDDTLIIPAERPTDIGGGQTLCECYYITISDGTLIRASNDPAHPDFLVVKSGTAGAVIAADGLSISIPGDVTWVGLSSTSMAHAIAVPDLELLPLFE